MLLLLLLLLLQVTHAYRQQHSPQGMQLVGSPPPQGSEQGSVSPMSHELMGVQQQHQAPPQGELDFGGIQQNVYEDQQQQPPANAQQTGQIDEQTAAAAAAVRSLNLNPQHMG